MNEPGQTSGKKEEEQVAKNALAIVTEISNANSLKDALEELKSVLKHVSVNTYISYRGINPFGNLRQLAACVLLKRRPQGNNQTLTGLVLQDNLFMAYAKAALDSGQRIRDYVKRSTNYAIPILKDLLEETLQEATGSKKEKIKARIEDCSKESVYHYIVDAAAVIFHEDWYIKQHVSKKQTIIITRTYKCATYIYHVRYCPQEAPNDSDEEIAAQAKSTGLPVVWLKTTDGWAVVVAGHHVYRQSEMADSFIAYFASFAMFDIDWCKNCKVYIYMYQFFTLMSASYIETCTLRPCKCHECFMFQRRGHRYIRGMPNKHGISFAMALFMTSRLDWGNGPGTPALGKPAKKAIARYYYYKNRHMDTSD